jgi:hypothetical protein
MDSDFHQPASSPGFVIVELWSVQRDADIDGIDDCSIPLYGGGEGCGRAQSHPGAEY